MSIEVQSSIHFVYPVVSTGRLVTNVTVKNTSSEKIALFKVLVDNQERYRVKPGLGTIEPGGQVDIELLVRKDPPEPLETVEDRCLIRAVQRETLPEEDLHTFFKTLTKDQYDKKYISVHYSREKGTQAGDESTAPAEVASAEETATAVAASRDIPDEIPISPEPPAPVTAPVAPAVPGAVPVAVPDPVPAIVPQEVPAEPEVVAQTTMPQPATPEAPASSPKVSIASLQSTLLAKEKMVADLKEELDSLRRPANQPPMGEQLKIVRGSIDEDLGSGSPLIHLAFMVTINFLVIRLLI